MRLKRVVAVAAAAMVAAAALAAFGYHRLSQEFLAPGPTHAPLQVDVAPGASLRAVLGQLQVLGAIGNARRAALYLRLHRQAPTIKAGRYQIPADASPAQIVELLATGRVVLEQLTIIEGSTFADLRRALANDPAVTATLANRSDAQVMAALGRPGEAPEGRFFPDTYRFAAHTSDLEILKLAYASMQHVLEDAWRERTADLPLANPYEALILASIIEKETGLAAERPRIAGVFVARLRRNMRLQSDPTVIYGLGAQYDGSIHTRDLTTDTPYNTYTRGGLPPTPIALPGREALLAAVHPEDTGELYFVATGQGDGAHQFSKTLEEHDAAIRRYLARLRAPR